MLVRVPWGTSSRWRGSDRRGVNDAAVRLLLPLLLLLLAGPRLWLRGGGVGWWQHCSLSLLRAWLRECGAVSFG